MLGCMLGAWALLAVGLRAAEPTDILLSNQQIVEWTPPGMMVTTLTAVDSDPEDTHTFRLVTGTGSAHNFAFRIPQPAEQLDPNDANAIAIDPENGILNNQVYYIYEADRDYETDPVTWNLRIQVTDSTGLTYSKALNFHLADDRLEDADGDGLTEQDEEDLYGTSDLVFDSDSDGVGDGAEVDGGASPTDADEWPETAFVGWGNDADHALAAPTGGGFTALATGQNHSLTVRSDGGVFAWGGNDTYGQSSVPEGLADVVEVSAGGDFWEPDTAHSVALKRDGTVVGWGCDHDERLVLPEDLEDVISVAAGRSFCLALQDDGTVRAWGYNPHGEVDPPSGLSEVVAISAGGFHSLALRQDGTVVSWGARFDGVAWKEAEVPGGLTNVVEMAAGRFHSLALRGDGSVVAWGYNSHGQTDVPAGLTDVVAVAAGGFHSLALRADGSVVAWGSNSEGQCTVPDPAQGAVRKISAGLQHSLALRQSTGYPRISSDPHLIGEPGETLSYQIMVEDALPAAFWVSSLPEGLSLDSETGEIAGTPLAPARSSVRVQVDTDQGVLSQIVWIEVSEGEPPTAIQISPAEVPEGAPQGSLVGTLTATDPDVTDSHSFMLVSGSGDGDNHRFRIEGDHLEVNQAITEDHEQGATTFSVRIRATDPSFHTWEQVILLDLIDDRNEDADGDGLSEAEEEDVHLTSDLTTDSDGDGFGDRYELDAGTNPSLGTEFPEGNMIVAWGDNSEGQAETGPHPGAVFLDVSAGYRHTLGLRTDGTVEAWGRNDHGQIDVPPGLTDVVQVSAGDLHSIALLSDGSVVAWGNDEFGQGSVPAGLENVVSVSSGAYHNLALLADGTVTAWGEDGYNQCQVPSGLGGVIEVSAGGFHSLALKQDGTVVVWGRDSFNVLDVPEELSEVVGIAAGGYHNLAVLHDGSVVAWGATDKGQCDVPTGLAGVREVSAGWRFSMARLDDGGVVAWGENTAGQCNVPAEAIHAGALDAGDDHVVLVRQDAGFPGFADPSPLAAWPGDAVARSFALVHASASGYEAAGLPADLTLDPTDGTLTGTVTSGSRNAVRITSFTDVGRLVAVVWMNTADGVAPTDIQLSPAEVMENMPAASLVGILTATDPDPGDSFTYELDFSGEVPDSFRFEIDGDILRTRYDSIDFETVPNPLSIRVVVIDSGGNTFSKNLSVTLLNDRDEDTDGDGFSEAFEEDVLGSSDLDGTDLSTSDFDKDGIPGFLEHAFNLPPKTSGPHTYLEPGGGSTAGLPVITLVSDGAGGRRLRMEYIQRTDPAYTYRPKFGDGSFWALPSAAVEVTPAGTGWERCVVEDVDGGEEPARRFGRVEVSH